MEELDYTKSASGFIDDVNANLEEMGSEAEVSASMSAGTLVSTLNNVFDDVDDAVELDNDQDAETFVANLNTNFGLAEDSEEELGKLKFLHYSDPHDKTSAAGVCNDMLTQGNESYDPDLSFVIVTGDFSYRSDNVASQLRDKFSACPSGKLLMLPGNHDTYDNYFGADAKGQSTTTAFIKGYIGNSVNWGDTNNVASYWYKDIAVGNRKLRIISLDQYEIDVVRKPANYLTMYSQAQVDWFINLLEGLGKNDYLIIAMHEPPVQSQNWTSGGPNDPYAESLAPSSPYFVDGELREPMKLFVSEYGGNVFGNGARTSPNYNLFPRIMDAYLNKRSLNITYTNRGGNTSSPDITINHDFSDATPCTFLFYICGHQHCDKTNYLPDESDVQLDGGDWSDQLMLVIAAADRTVIYSDADDMGGSGGSHTVPNPSSETYRINEVELDFDNKRITITRIGDMNTANGRVRDQITFPFKKATTS